MIDRFEIQKLRDLPIEQVAQRLQLTVKHHKSLCPFHDDRHPSLSYNPRRNMYRCFVCGASGGPIDLTMHLLGKPFGEACRWLAGEHSLSLRTDTPGSHRPDQEEKEPRFDPRRYARYFEHPWLSPEACRFLYDERRLDPRVVRWCRLSSWRDRTGTHWLQIPYYDLHGQLVGLQSRNLDYRRPCPEAHQPQDGKPQLPQLSGVEPQPQPEACKPQMSGAEPQPQPEAGKAQLSGTEPQPQPEACKAQLSGTEPQPPGGKPEAREEPRFRFPRGSQCRIYNLPVLRRLREGEALYITEGCSDCWAMLSSGRKAIAIPSATLLQPHDIDELRRLTASRSITLHMYPDRDLPGEQLYLQLRDLLPTLQHHQLPPGCKDYGEAWKHLKNLKFKI